MCARQGENYREENINLKVSTLNCSKYLLKQIEIVKTKVILTLEYFSLLSLSKIFGFDIGQILKETILRFSENSNLTVDDCLTNVLKNLYR